VSKALCATAVLAALAGVFAPVASAADEAPEWLRVVAARKLPEYPAKVPAVILIRETGVVVEDSGRIVTSERYAVRILNRAGLTYARVLKSYARDTGKVRDLRAWTVAASGELRKLPKEAYADVALGDDALYEDVRGRIANGQSQCDPGSVFAYESEVEDKSIFTQLEWAAQNDLPVRSAGFSLSVPAGWESKGIVINAVGVKPTHEGLMSRWEFHDLAFIEQEESSPELESIAPRVAVSLFPPGGMSPNNGPSFAKWRDVSRWLAGLNDPQGEPNAEITAKVRSLTQGLATPEARIRVLAEYVQRIRYVSIQTGLGRGGGYKPHPAAMIFAKSYGDCKDKATLLRAMLKAAGVEAWPVAIYSGDPLYVREEWPTPQQFNHAILAIRAPENAASDAFVKSDLGPLLMFDPTDEDTPFGQVPVHEQNSFALLVAPENGGLLRMPAVRPDSNRIDRMVTATVGADGSIRGALHEDYAGWPYTVARHSQRRASEQDYVKRLESRIARGIRAARISDVKTADAPLDGRFSVDLSFSSVSYAQIMQGRLMVFRPSILHPSEPVPSGQSKRQHPAIVNAGTWTQSTRVQLPREFEPDEVPSSVHLESPFGSYDADCKIEAGVLTFTRKLTLKSVVVPPEQFAKLNEFGEQVVGADQTPVVLAKK
jgi:hypothetical protein